MAEQEDIPFEELIDWAEGRLSPQRAEEIARHVARNPALADQATWLARFLENARPLKLVTPPPEVANRLRAQLRELRAGETTSSASKPWAWVERLVASLSLDSLGQPLAAGVRGSGGGYRQLAYTTARADVALSIVASRPRGGSDTGMRVDIHGQIFPQADGAAGPQLYPHHNEDNKDGSAGEGGIPPYLVQFIHSGGEVAAVESDALGEFEVPGVVPGMYEVVFSRLDHEIVLAAVPLALDEDTE